MIKWHENGPRRVLRGPLYLVAGTVLCSRTSRSLPTLATKNRIVADDCRRRPKRVEKCRPNGGLGYADQRMQASGGFRWHRPLPLLGKGEMMAESGAGLRGRWAGLPKWGMVVVVAPAAILVMLLSGGCGHSSSWQWGHDSAREAAPLLSSGISEENACGSIARSAIKFKDSRALVTSWPDDLDDAVAGCLAGLKDMGR